MGCEVQKGYDGRELDVHRFDDDVRARNYLTVGRGYKFERHEPWAFTSGIDFYQGPNPNERASLRQTRENGALYWIVYFWTTDNPITRA